MLWFFVLFKYGNVEGAPEGHRESGSEFGSLTPAKCLVVFQPGFSQF